MSWIYVPVFYAEHGYASGNTKIVLILSSGMMLSTVHMFPLTCAPQQTHIALSSRSSRISTLSSLQCSGMFSTRVRWEKCCNLWIPVGLLLNGGGSSCLRQHGASSDKHLSWRLIFLGFVIVVIHISIKFKKRRKTPWDFDVGSYKKSGRAREDLTSKKCGKTSKAVAKWF